MNKFAAVLLLFGPCCAMSAVADSSAGGFTIKLTYTVKATPAAVYDGFVHNIGEWWNAEHTFSRDAHNLSIEEKPLGCFCEKLPDGGGVRHMEVIYLAPGKALGLSGGLGPLQTMAVTGSMRFVISPAESGSELEVTYAVGGYLKPGLDSLAKPVDGVLLEQITRLKNYTEHGSPAPK